MFWIARKRSRKSCETVGFHNFFFLYHMLGNTLQSCLTATRFQTSRAVVGFWFGLTLACGIGYAIAVLPASFAGEYIVQDDARQHVFWMQRFVDSQLFPDDLIADYFQSVAPWGYSTLYQIAASLGIEPFVFNKIVPVVIGIAVTVLSFGIVLEVFPIPAAAFFSTLVLNQNLWCKDDIISGTPRAFLYPFFLGFVYFLLRRNILACIICIALTGLFYPQFLLIEAGVLCLTLLDFPKFDKIPQMPLSWLPCLGVAIAMLAIYAFKTNPFAPVVDFDLAQQLPEFYKGGRIYFFHPDPIEFWFVRDRSGFLPKKTALTLWLGLAFPVMLLYSKRFPLLQQLTPKAKVLLKIFITSVGLFALAHLILFKLHLPSRYSEHTNAILLALTSGIALVAAMDAAFQARKYRRVKVGFTLLLAVGVMSFPLFLERFPKTYSLVEGETPALYEFFQSQPKDILIASTAKEADNLPTFAQRSILVGHEYAIPYHYGYYQQFRDRAVAVFESQYSPDIEAVRETIRRYGIDFWLLDVNAFAPDYLSDRQWGSRWRRQFIGDPELIARLERGERPALANYEQTCKVFETELHRVLSAECLLEN